MFDFGGKFSQGLAYHDFLHNHGTDEHRRRWQGMYDRVQLSPAQRELLASFKREMKVLCLAGAWCGDCVNQCPSFEHFSQANPRIVVRYFDRDTHADLAAEVKICGARARAGDRRIERGRHRDYALRRPHAVALSQVGRRSTRPGLPHRPGPARAGVDQCRDTRLARRVRASTANSADERAIAREARRLAGRLALASCQCVPFGRANLSPCLI